jgi:iron(III) transport system substrate-binding protein
MSHHARRRFMLQGMTGALATTAWPLLALAAKARPRNYPESYRQLIDAARREGKVVVLGSTDRLSAEPLVKAFEAAYPDIRVTYSDLNTRDVDKQIRAEANASPVSDVVWSSAMDTQLALVQENFAQAYASPEAHNIPSWAEWRQTAYAATYEPVVFAYNKQLFPEAEAATSHAALMELMQSQRKRLSGKVVMLDMAKSSLALMLEAQDQLANPNHDALLQALGAAKIQFPPNNAQMLKQIASGESWLGYNMLGSYAEVFSRANPQVAYVIPRDYALVVSRVMFISARSPHPNAARVWLDFVLSPAGQSVMASQCGLGAVREDVDGPFTLSSLRAIPGLRLRPIGVSMKLLDHLDPVRRNALIARAHGQLGV